jgi:hypothetical protein
LSACSFTCSKPPLPPPPPTPPSTSCRSLKCVCEYMCVASVVQSYSRRSRRSQEQLRNVVVVCNLICCSRSTETHRQRSSSEYLGQYSPTHARFRSIHASHSHRRRHHHRHHCCCCCCCCCCCDRNLNAGMLFRLFVCSTLLRWWWLLFDLPFFLQNHNCVNH